MSADATMPAVACQRRQDGNAAVPSGKTLDIESGGALAIAGVDVTSKLSAQAGATVNAYTQTYSTPNRTVAAPTAAAPAAATATAPVTLTDSTGLSGTHDDTLAATTVPAALTEGAGAIGGSNDGDLPALVDPAGDAGASVIAGIRENATKINAILTLLAVMAQNQSDVAQKVIELRTSVAALLVDDAAIATSATALVADDLDNRQTITALIDDLQANGLAS